MKIKVELTLGIYLSLIIFLEYDVFKISFKSETFYYQQSQHSLLNYSSNFDN